MEMPRATGSEFGVVRDRDRPTKVFMALTTREIPKGEWRTYFDAFSRDLGELRATVEIAGMELGDQIEAEHPRLTGITYDDKDDILVIGLDAPGGVPEDLEHVVYGPQKIYIAEGQDEMTVFDVEDADRNQTLIRLEPAG
jgi:hypothetical protein